MKNLSVLIIALLIVTMPLIGQVSAPKKDGITTTVKKDTTKKSAERYFQMLTNKEMTEYKEYFSQFPDSVGLSDLTMGDLRIVMAYTYTAAVREARDIARQEIHQRAVELPARTDTATWRAYGLQPGKPYEGFLFTRMTGRMEGNSAKIYLTKQKVDEVAEDVNAVATEVRVVEAKQAKTDSSIARLVYVVSVLEKSTTRMRWVLTEDKTQVPVPDGVRAVTRTEDATMRASDAGMELLKLENAALKTAGSGTK